GFGEGGVAEKLAVFAVNGDEIFGADEGEEELHLFLAGVAGDVNGRGAAALIIDEDAAAEEMVNHAEDGLLVAGDDAGGEDDGVVLVDFKHAVVADGDARHGGHGLGLAAAGEDDEFLGIEGTHILRADDAAVGDAQAVEAVGDLDVVHHAAADEADFAADAAGDVDDLLDAVDGAGEAGDDDFLRGGAEKLFEGGPDGALGESGAGALDVGTVAEKGEDAFLAVAGEGVEVEGAAVDGRGVNLEVAGVDDDA